MPCAPRKLPTSADSCFAFCRNLQIRGENPDKGSCCGATTANRCAEGGGGRRGRQTAGAGGEDGAQACSKIIEGGQEGRQAGPKKGRRGGGGIADSRAEAVSRGCESRRGIEARAETFQCPQGRRTRKSRGRRNHGRGCHGGTAQGAARGGAESGAGLAAGCGRGTFGGGGRPVGDRAIGTRAAQASTHPDRDPNPTRRHRLGGADGVGRVQCGTMPGNRVAITTLRKMAAKSPTSCPSTHTQKALRVAMP